MNNGHLSIEQIESLSQQESQSLRQQTSDDWYHVENCDHCRSLVEKCRLIDARLSKLASAHLPTRSDMNCPDEKTWFEVAAGVLPEEESMQYLEHASTCDGCGRTLKVAVQIFEQELSPEDEQLINKLPSSISHAQTSSSEKKIKKDDKGRSLFQFWRSAAYAISGLILLGFIGWGSIKVYEAHENRLAKEVLEAEYKKGRPTEYRVADLPYGPSRAQLGATDKRYIQVSGHNPTYRAAAALLKFDSSSAIEILEKARDSGNTSKSVLNDLVVAYAMEYSQTGSERYLQTALQLANEVIQKYSTDPVAYFNRALIYESLNCPDCSQKAHADFEQVISLDPDPKWVQETKYKLR